jgi:hypothetical protein
MARIFGWLFSRQTQRRGLIGLVGLVTLVAIFYLEEDWRGKRAWETFKQDAEAKGVVLDWDKFIPAPVPDDENFFTASTNIALRFKKPQGDAETERAAGNPWLHIIYDTNSFPVFNNTKAAPLLVANIVVVLPPGLAGGSHNPALTLTDPGTRAQVGQTIQTTIGRTAYGAAGFEFSELQLSNLAPARILLEADAPPALADIENLLPPDLATNLGHVRVETGADKDTFRVLLADVRVTTAADYLKWSDQFVPAFDEVREALKRPDAILPGDYSQPALIPVPNFVTMRTVAQTLAQRAQCDFLLNRPDEALHELTLVHDFCRILKRPPVGKPITLVESMINVAIAGLYAGMVADGLRLHAWKEPQLAALEQQLKEDDLSRWVIASLEGEEVYSSFNMLNPTPELIKALWGNIPLRQKLKDPSYIFFEFAPHGWLYQNAIVHVTHMQSAIQCFDVSNQLIFPQKMDAWAKSWPVRSTDPYSFLEAFYLPNMSKATQRTADMQTMVNEAEVACALERFHLAHGEYPETLDGLVPQFIEATPHDIIGGQPLHYRRTDDGKFLLYSIGWNETDDGGVPGTDSDMTKGDWVWKE